MRLEKLYPEIDVKGFYVSLVNTLTGDHAWDPVTEERVFYEGEPLFISGEQTYRGPGRSGYRIQSDYIIKPLYGQEHTKFCSHLSFFRKIKPCELAKIIEAHKKKPINPSLQPLVNDYLESSDW